MKAKPGVVVILGSNASGKSSLGIKLAREFNGEIISADSRQVYRGLDIGAGKITKSEMKGVRHHMLNIKNPKKVFTVAKYQEKAKRALRGILRRGNLPIIVGGTGFYIDALVYSIDFPKVPPQKNLRKELEKLDTRTLFERLGRIDPDRAIVIDSKNRRRLIRAIEIVEATGKRVPYANKLFLYDVLKIGIKHDDEKLKKRIGERLDRRLQGGMIEEVERLSKKVGWQRLNELGLEYRYIADYLQNKIGREEMRDKLFMETWHFAKRQMTWFKRDEEIIWIDSPKNEVDAFKKASPIIQNFLIPKN